MELTLKPLEWFQPFERNPRQISQEDVIKLAASISALGFRDPIEARPNGDILVGHRRLLAARHLGLARAPVIIHSEMTDEEAAAYRISNNRLGEDVKWDRALLADELTKIENLLPPDMLGFTEADIVKLFDLDGGPPEMAPTDAAASSEPGPFVRRGEVWDIGPATFRVYDNLSEDGLRKAEALIPKMSKLLKQPATLEGRQFKEVIAERAIEAGLQM